MSEIISAFAFKTGQAIEKIVNDRTNDLEEHNRRLEALILSYRQSIEDVDELVRFDRHFYVVD